MRKLSWWLMIVGGLNWLLVGVLNMNLVARVFGDMTTIARVVYTLVGVSTAYQLWMRMGK